MTDPATGLSTETVTSIESQITDWMSEDRIPGASLVVVADGERVYTEGFGSRDLDANDPATPETLYGIGSCSKSFTALAVCQLAEAGELDLLRRRAGRDTRSPTVEPVLDDERVQAVKQAPEGVRVEGDLLQYMVSVARATREDRRVDVGVSPRGTQRLFEAARARAAVKGREYVVPEDVKRLAPNVLAHRLVLTPDAAVENVAKRDVVDSVLDEVAVPTVEA